MIGAIAFVPEDDVPTAWRFLKPLLPLDMVEFSSYFENTWIGTSSRDPTFARSKWNLHDSTKMLLPRSSDLAPWVSLHALLQQPNHLEVPRVPQSWTEPDRCEADTETTQTTPWKESSQVDKVRPETSDYCGLLWRLWYSWLSESCWVHSLIFLISYVVNITYLAYYIHQYWSFNSNI